MSNAKAARANPFKKLVYVYTGTSNFDKDVDFYQNKLGARLVWNRQGFGARVAAFDLCGEPFLLIADHVKARDPARATLGPGAAAARA